MKYYLAYGSNLATRQMKQRTSDAVLVGTGLLKDYILEFKTVYYGNAFATITKKVGEEVPVTVFKISDKDEERLDIYEGVRGRHYFKDEVEVVINNEKIKAMVYIMNLNATYSMPRKYYVSTILEGYIEYEFSKKYLFDALRKVGMEEY